MAPPLLLGTFFIALVGVSATRTPAVFLSGEQKHRQTPPWMIIPHIVNGGKGTAEQPPVPAEQPASVPPAPAVVAALNQPKHKQPRQELERFGSVTNTVALSTNNDEPEEKSTTKLLYTNTCWYLLIVLIINCCCLGGAGYSKNLQILCGLVHAAIPLGILIYVWFASPILKDFFAGKTVGTWCLILCIWATIQITCGLCLCTMMCLGFGVRTMAGYKDED